MRQSIGLRLGFRKWQDERICKLTTNLFTNAIGFRSHQRVRLWLEKVGVVEHFARNSNNFKKETALEQYKRITGHSVMVPEFLVSPKKNPKDYWLAAPHHGLVDKIVNGKRYQGVVEIKCPSFNANTSSVRPCSHIPHHWMPEAQGLMEIVDRDWLDYYIWTPKASSLFRIYRDVEYWDVLKMGLSEFWWNHVQPARERIFDKKFVVSNQLIQELKSLRPAAKHELYSYVVKENKRVVDNSEMLMCEMNGKLIDHHRYRLTISRDAVKRFLQSSRP